MLCCLWCFCSGVCYILVWVCSIFWIFFFSFYLFFFFFYHIYFFFFFFFFQAEDGIRDWSVTGVQTCALPIWSMRKRGDGATAFDDTTGEVSGAFVTARKASPPGVLFYIMVDSVEATCRTVEAHGGSIVQPIGEIGRASCRERVWKSGGAATIK